MRSLLFALVILGVSLGACAADMHWTKPGATAEDFNRDSYECATTHTATSRSFAPFKWYSEDLEVNKDLYRLCMTGRGYQRVPGGPWVGVRD